MFFREVPAFSIAGVRRSLENLVERLRHEESENRDFQVLEQCEQICLLMRLLLQPIKSNDKMSVPTLRADVHGVPRLIASQVEELVAQARLSFRLRDSLCAVEKAQQALVVWRWVKEPDFPEEIQS